MGVIIEESEGEGQGRGLGRMKECVPCFLLHFIEDWA